MLLFNKFIFNKLSYVGWGGPVPQGMAVELAEAAEAAGAYRSRNLQLIRISLNNSIFHAF